MADILGDNLLVIILACSTFPYHGTAIIVKFSIFNAFGGIMGLLNNTSGNSRVNSSIMAWSWCIKGSSSLNRADDEADSEEFHECELIVKLWLFKKDDNIINII